MSYRKTRRRPLSEKIASSVQFGKNIRGGGITMQTARDIWGYDFSPDLSGLILGARKPMRALWDTVFGTQDANGNNQGDGLIWIQGFVGRGFNPLGRPVMGVPQGIVQAASNALTPSPVAGADVITATFDHAYPGTARQASLFTGGQPTSLREVMSSDTSDVYVDPETGERDFGYGEFEASVDVEEEDAFSDERDLGYEDVEADVEDSDVDEGDLGLADYPFLEALASDADRWIKLKVKILNAPNFLTAVEIWREFFGLRDTRVVNDLGQMLDELDDDQYDDGYLKGVVANKVLPEFATASWRLLLQTLKDNGNLSDEAMAPAYSIYAKVREAM